MTDRRRSVRFRLHDGWIGQFQFLEDVLVDSASDNHMTVVSALPAARGDQLRLEVSGSSPGEYMTVEVVESRPVTVSGRLAYRLELSTRSAVNRTEQETFRDRRQAVSEESTE